MSGMLYLHGFTSGPQSTKARVLHQRMGSLGLGEHFLCPQLPHSPRAAIALCDALIERHQPAALVGSSLGGYYATWLAEKHGLRAVLVNPAVVAHIALERYIGPQQSVYTGECFDFTHEHIDELRALEVGQLAQPDKFWLLVETGDETLDYHLAVEKYRGARQTVLPGGDHSFTRWGDYLDEIIAFAS
jgi:hypothetical protein